MSSLLAQLLEYRRLGWAIVPACPPDHRGVKPVHAQGCNTPGETPLFAWRSYEDQIIIDNLDRIREAWDEHCGQQ